MELAQLPSNLQPVEPLTTGDLNGDGLPERLSLSSNRASIYENEDLVWQSPPEWSISQAALTDLNQDGQLEATLLVWREFRPWPVDAWLPHGGRIASFHDAQNQSCQIILIGYSRGAYRELWAGSALADPIVSFAAADLDGDDVQELATLEGSYTTHQSGIAHTLKIWRWNFFGFNAVSSIEGT
ncbi:MAG TPA: VCBS repeat-containing protein, partial [Anaerolineaceae bacterium]|nr:VCBS repeat-containing protein [Anaerolineaceae bacterium]